MSCHTVGSVEPLIRVMRASHILFFPFNIQTFRGKKISLKVQSTLLFNYLFIYFFPSSFVDVVIALFCDMQYRHSI